MHQADQDIMENWKKLIIMDPVLNVLFDSAVNPERFVADFIAQYPPEEVSRLYVKLGTCKHAIAKYLQKEVERNSRGIIQNFNKSNQTRISIEDPSSKKLQLTQQKDSLALYNSKYQAIARKTTELKNTYAMLGFAKQVQRYVVQMKMLTSLSSKNSNNMDTMVSIHRVQISQILAEISSICRNTDFTGIKMYESQRAYLKNLRDAVAKKNEAKFAESMDQSTSTNKQPQIRECVKVAHNLGALADMIKAYFNQILQHIMDDVKRLLISENLVENQIDNPCNLLVKKSFEILQLERVLKELELQEYLASRNIDQLFPKLWAKIVQIMDKSLKKIFEFATNSNTSSPPQGKWHAKLSELRTKYPLILFKFEEVLTDVHTQLLLSHYSELGYSFRDISVKFVQSLGLLAKQYETYVQTASKQRFENLDKSVNTWNPSQISQSLDTIVSFYTQLLRIIRTPYLMIELVELFISNLQSMGKGVENAHRIQIIMRYLTEQMKTLIGESSCGRSITLDHIKSLARLGLVKKAQGDGARTDLEQEVKELGEPLSSKLLKMIPPM